MHRTVAAVFTTFISIGVLAALHDRPSMSNVVTWVDCESLLLIASMMVLVAILSDTGFFEHIALYAFQVNINENVDDFFGINWCFPTVLRCAWGLSIR